MSEITRLSACSPRDWTHPIPEWVEPGQHIVLCERLDMADEFTLSVGRKAAIAIVDDVWVKITVFDSSDGPAINVTQSRGDFVYFWRPEHEPKLRTEA